MADLLSVELPSLDKMIRPYSSLGSFAKGFFRPFALSVAFGGVSLGSALLGISALVLSATCFTLSLLTLPLALFAPQVPLFLCGLGIGLGVNAFQLAVSSLVTGAVALFGLTVAPIEFFTRSIATAISAVINVVLGDECCDPQDDGSDQYKQQYSTM